MHCRDAAGWRLVLRHRFEEQGEAPTGWSEVLEHLAACAECRRLGVAVDPTLTWSLRASLRSDRAADDESRDDLQEVQDLQQAVAERLRWSRLGQIEESRVPRAPRWPWAASIAATAMLLLVPVPAAQWDALLPGEPGGPSELGQASAVDAVDGASALPLPLTETVELLEHPNARVYELADEEMAVVIIVDQSFDV